MSLYEIYKNIPDNKTDFDKFCAYMEKHDCRNRLWEWVANTYELDEMKDIIQHGMVAGFHSLTYYTDTIAFYDKFAEEIWDLISDNANDHGMTEMEFIASWNGQKNVGSDAQFKNLLCWFAVEECARCFIDNIECEAE
jgi:hypothetical protein